jgi:recombination protein RecA
MAKKKAEEDRFARLMQSDLIAKIQKKHGKSILTPADEFKIKRVPRIPTGIFFYDYALGGGFPAGRTNIVWGHKSTGKTVICLRAMGNAQKLCANCYTFPDPETGKCQCGKFRETICSFLDVEGSWDHDWAKLHGVNPDRVLLSVPEYAEQTLDIAEALLRSGDVDFLVIDSLAFMTPAKEIEESAGKALQAEQARVLGRGIRKFGAALNHMGNVTGRRPTLLFTNQIRMKVGLLFGNPETQPGGYAPGFSATTETKTFGGKYEMDEVTGRPLHVDMSFRVEKNKSAGAKIEGEWRLMLADTTIKKKGEVYDEPAMVEMGIKIGLVEKDGNGWTCLGEKYRSKSLLTTALVEGPGLKAQFKDTMMSVLTAG